MISHTYATPAGDGLISVLALARRDCVRDLDLYAGMLRLRGEVFGSALPPEAILAGDFELDRFDALDPTYLIAVDETRAVLGTLRALPTSGPTPLTDIISPDIGHQALTSGIDVIEASRLCIDARRAPAMGPHGLHVVTSALLAGLIEWCLLHRVTRVLGAFDRAMERLLGRAGLRAHRLGPVRALAPGGKVMLAAEMAADHHALSAVCEAGGLTDAVRP